MAEALDFSNNSVLEIILIFSIHTQVFSYLVRIKMIITVGLQVKMKKQTH